MASLEQLKAENARQENARDVQNIQRRDQLLEEVRPGCTQLPAARGVLPPCWHAPLLPAMLAAAPPAPCRAPHPAGARGGGQAAVGAVPGRKRQYDADKQVGGAGGRLCRVVQGGWCRGLRMVVQGGAAGASTCCRLPACGRHRSGSDTTYTHQPRLPPRLRPARAPQKRDEARRQLGGAEAGAR